MPTRTRLVTGSLLGAAAIHLAMLACSGGVDTGALSRLDASAGDALQPDAPTTADAPSDPPDTPTPTPDVATTSDAPPAQDAGFLDALIDVVRDAIGEVVDAEVRDAHAGGDSGVADAGPTACACPTPPTPTASFSLTLDRGGGVERPDAPWSTARMSVTTSRGLDGAAIRVLDASASFYQGENSRSLSCSVRVNAEFTLAAQVRCSMTIEPTGLAGSYTGDRTNSVITGARVTVFEQERLELRYDSLRLCRSSTDCITVRDVVFRAYTPGARYRDIPSAYAP